MRDEISALVVPHGSALLSAELCVPARPESGIAGRVTDPPRQQRTAEEFDAYRKRTED